MNDEPTQFERTGFGADPGFITLEAPAPQQDAPEQDAANPAEKKGGK